MNRRQLVCGVITTFIYFASSGLSAQQQQLMIRPVRAFLVLVNFVRKRPDWHLTFNPEMRGIMKDAEFIRGNGSVFYRSEREFIIINANEIIHIQNSGLDTIIRNVYADPNDAALAIYGSL